MIYKRIQKGRFLKRPNRFIAKIEINGKEETVHVKNTGRCAELLVPGAEVYVQKSESAGRKTGWDLISVRKADRLINMDSQVTNKVVQEWIEAGRWFKDVKIVRPEVTYKNSRFDLYVEYEEKKAFIEVKGVTLEEEGVVKFPDAPSERAVKHLKELEEAVQEGYEAYVFFVVQMKGVRYFTPNRRTHKEFADILAEAAETGVQVIAKDCFVTEDSIAIADEVPVVLTNPQLYEAPELLVEWYRERKRDLPWRHHVNAYRVWVSEIMLQQTRVEAVKPYFDRFLKELPDVAALSDCPEEKLLKLWEGLGYYNRVRNMQIAAQTVMENYHGELPADYEALTKLKGIGHYTAGAIASIAFGIPVPAVDGNVLRVISRVTEDDADIMKASVRTAMEKDLLEIMPENRAGAFNQALMELGATVCLPNGAPLCEACPWKEVCRAQKSGRWRELPVKSKAKARRIEDRTVLVIKAEDKVLLHKRANKGLLAGLYEFPNVEGHLKEEEVITYLKKMGLSPIRLKKLEDSRHIFSHIEWHMTGYAVQIDETEQEYQNMLFVDVKETEEQYPIPAAFSRYTGYMNIRLGNDRYKEE